ncbi:hypothetical protein C2E31_02995 [Rhodopirellula baltica]|nr:hypothetical protein C2E31_02995 [Rhodopirellula baltica]
MRSETPTATPSARLKGLQRFEQAAESCGVGTGTLMNFIRRGQIKPVMIAKASHIRVRDFDRIRELAFDLPAPGDPTPEEIAERCRLVRQRGCSADADVESDVLAILAKRSLSITEIKTRLSRKQADTRSTLERLVSSGAVIKSDGPLTRYCRAGSDSMLESADQILCRFRQRACTKSRRRCVAA